MSAYTPDLWVIVEVDSKEHGKLRKVLGSWYGRGFGGDEWRFSSGITKIEEKLDDKYPHYLIHNESGSVYTCYANCVGWSSYTSDVYNDLKKQMEEQGLGTMERVTL